MGLETGTYIDSLNASNPAATDALSQADEHLRLIKSTLKSTFPSVAGAVTATHTAINTKVAEPVSAITSDGSSPSINTSAGVTAANLRTLLGVTEGAITTSTDSGGEVTPALATGITAAEVWNLIKAEALNSTYPIGAIYASVANTSPASAFGGTWTPYGAGKVLAGHDYNDPADADFVASSTDGSSEKTGGAKTTDVAVSTTVPRDGWGNEQSGNAMAEPNTAGRLITGDGSTESGETMESLAHASGDRTFTSATSAVSTLQPYVVVYMWKRTA
jgi:hypothetical protein